MTDKLYRYCSILLAIMFCVMIYTVYDVSVTVIRGLKNGEEITALLNSVGKDKGPLIIQDGKEEDGIGLKNEDWIASSPIALTLNDEAKPVIFVNQKTGKEQKVWPRYVDINYKSPHYFLGIKAIGFSLVVILSVVLLIVALKLFMNFRNSENIFEVRNLKLIRILAIITVSYYVVLWLVTLGEIYFIHKSFSIAGYSMSVLKTLDLPGGLYKIPLMFIVYEIFLIGVKMREENQLTV